MKYFGNRRPRGFHYTRRFGNEQRDILESLRRGVSPEEIAEQSYREAMEEANSDGSKRNRYGVSRQLICKSHPLEVMSRLFTLGAAAPRITGNSGAGPTMSNVLR